MHSCAHQLLAFANLLEAAHIAELDRTYDAQEELVRLCRAEGRAFLASMPIRHRFRCGECGIEATEVELHFEDPGQPLAGAGVGTGLWGKPTGRYFETTLSSLHAVFTHSADTPLEFASLLNNAFSPSGRSEHAERPGSS